FKCHGSHGNTDVTESIKTSCNTFFYKLALDLGFEKIIHYGEIFGFGEKTFIDLPFEKSGNYISMESLNKKYNNNIPRGLLLNYGIGQGEILATPIQMASYTATLANNGIMHQPHVVNAIYNNITDKIEPLDYKSRKIDIKEEYFEIIKQGMFKVVNEPGGTARIAQVSGVNVAGKTGTAQNPHGKDHAWFVCFAPVEDPQIAMAVFVENSGFGGSVAAPIARELLDYFFHPDSLDFNPVPIPLSPPDSASTDEIITTN
ncbi:MAG: penicillin-binding transpeptidase domain-containing protein, partial [Bacteroidota bacterium]